MPSCLRASPPTAFTLTEVMFAVILLGIGFIMVAAMFPIAIQQSRSSTEETSASVVARAAMAHLSQIANGTTMPTSAEKPVSNDKFWQAVRGVSIDQSDPRYAWSALYRRADKSPTAQVYVFVLQVRNHSAFNLNDIEPKEQTQPTTFMHAASIQPKLVDFVKLSENVVQVLDHTGSPATPAAGAAAEGAHVILTDIEPGRVLRLGNPVSRIDNTWELMPGSVTGIQLNSPVPAYLVGRGYHPDTPNGGLAFPPPYEGPAMDIAVFTGFVQVK